MLAALSSESDDLEAFERHATDVAGLDAEEAVAAVAARLADGNLDL